MCGGSGPSRCTSIPSRASLRAGAPRAWMRLKRNSYRTGRGAAPTRLHSRSTLRSLPPCRCVRVPCRRGSSHRAFLHQLPSRLPVTPGCTKSSMTVRVIARKNGHRVRLYSRPGNDLTPRFPLIVKALARLRPRSCIGDEEAVSRGEDAPFGVPNPGQPTSETLRIAERERNTIHEAVEQIVGPFGCFLIADAEPHD